MQIILDSAGNIEEYGKLLLKKGEVRTAHYLLAAAFSEI
jgi:hypothetical protein